MKDKVIRKLIAYKEALAERESLYEVRKQIDILVKMQQQKIEKTRDEYLNEGKTR